MRLTLRTLLAYLDNILLPEDRDDIGAKIRDSEFATSLEHKIQDVTGRARLGTPQLIGAGMGRDPNSVAEYLDNTLAPEQVQLFEKVCLESDVHLAEVASCHHICAMILGEPAQVDPASRERMYRLIEATLERKDAAPAVAAAAVVATPSPAITTSTPNGPTPLRTAAAVAVTSTPSLVASTTDDGATTRRKPEVPEYLRGGQRSRLGPIILTLLGAALGTAVLIVIFDHQRVFRALGLSTGPKSGEVANADPDPAGGTKPAPTNPDTTAKTPTVPDDKLGGTGQSGGNSKPPTIPPAVTPVDPKSNPATPPIAVPADSVKTGPTNAPPTDVVKGPGPVSGGPVAGGSSPMNPAPGTNPPITVVAVPVPVAGGTTTGPKGTDPIKPDVTTPSPPVAGPAPPVTPPIKGPEKGPDQVASIDNKIVPPPGVTDKSPPGSAPPAAPVTVGRFLSKERQVLLRSAGEGEPWERLTSGAQLHSGDRLLVLPGFRPKISVAGLSLELDGPTQVVLGSVTPAGMPDVQLAFGRMVVQTLADPTARLHVRLGDIAGILTFGDADSTLALDVRVVHPAGTDPEQVPSPRQALLFAASGKIGWTPDGAAGAGSGEPTVLTAKRRKVLCGVGAGTESNLTQVPAWIGAPDLTSLEQRASQGIEKALAPDRSVKLGLIEQAAAQRVEVRNLATRSCAYIGHFEPLIKGLSDEDQRAGWMTYMSELRDAAARDPKAAASIRGTLEQLRHDQAPEMYRMLWGYTAAGLNSGDARRLVAYLDNDSLDFRVMAFWNLQDITLMGLNYRPEYTAVKRRPSIVRWQKRLEERKIVPSTPVTPAAASPAAPSAPAGVAPAKETPPAPADGT
ncbi:MAG: hypothetical protein K8T25_19840 [Planctomycetia bacterium]|nr:hypothetical protein [Planctomycetia bacterium]